MMIESGPTANLTPKRLSAVAGSIFADTSLLWRTLQRWRPYICPVETLVGLVPEGASVLDVGCGGGLFLGLLHQTGRLGRGLGFDVSAKAIDTARSMAERVSKGSESSPLTFQRLSVEETWPDGTFDVVSMIDLMHHVARPARHRLFDQAALRVRRGGILLYKDMGQRPRWRALANRAHDLLLAGQWIHHMPIRAVEAWADDAGLRLEHAQRVHRLWYAHDIRIFRRPAETPATQ